METWSLLRNRVHRQAAERFWEELRNGTATIEPVGTADLEAAWQIGLSYRDQDFSLVNRTSFAVMRRLGMDRAASFDEHLPCSGLDQNVATPLRSSVRTAQGHPRFGPVLC
jgi:predicted nucleic acid-binding protein